MLQKPFPRLTEIHTVAFDFDGVFTNDKVWVDEDGNESVRCDRRDGLAFDLVRAFKRRGKLNAEFLILTKETNVVVLGRANKLKLDCHHGIGNKLAFMRTHLAARFRSNPDSFEGLMYLGNDLNDLPLMRRAGYAVAPSDAHARIHEVAHLVLPQRGGEGFVRAFIERLLGIDDLSQEEIDELVSDS